MFPAIYLPIAWGVFIAFACLWICTLHPSRIENEPISRPSNAIFGDTLCILLLFALAAACQYLLLDGPRPLLLQSGDAGNVASFVAGWLHHGRFVSDLVLANQHNYRFYITAMIPLVMFFDIFTHDLGTAYALLYFPLIFLQLLGFYFLGKHLFKSSLWALLLVVLTFPPIQIFGGEMWGVYSEPLVRMSFGAILPFLILLFLRLAHKPRWLPFLFMLCGISVYFHSVSAPTVTLALWLGAFALKPQDESFFKRFRRLILAGLVFIAIALPFALVFFAGFPSLQSSTAIVGMNASMRNTFASVTGSQYYHAWAALGMILRGVGAKYAFIWIPGLVAFFLVPRLRPEYRAICRFFLLFMLGIILGSFGIALVDQTVSGLLHRSPLEIDLIRNMHFMVPILILGCVWVLREASACMMTTQAHYSRIFAIAFFAITGVFAGIVWHETPTRISDALGISAAPNELSSKPDVDSSAMLTYIHNLPIDSSVLPIDAETMGLAIRYDSLQPVVYLRKDMNALMYSGSPDANTWWRDHQIMDSLLTASAAGEASQLLHKMVDMSKPKYLLFDAQRLSSVVAAAALRSGVVVMRNQRWSLVRLQ